MSALYQALCDLATARDERNAAIKEREDARMNDDAIADAIADAMIDANLNPKFCIEHAATLQAFGRAVLARSPSAAALQDLLGLLNQPGGMTTNLDEWQAAWDRAQEFSVVAKRLTETEIHARDWWCPHCLKDVPPEMVTKDREHYLEFGGCGYAVRGELKASPSRIPTS